MKSQKIEVRESMKQFPFAVLRITTTTTERVGFETTRVIKREAEPTYYWLEQPRDKTAPPHMGFESYYSVKGAGYLPFGAAMTVIEIPTRGPRRNWTMLDWLQQHVLPSLFKHTDFGKWTSLHFDLVREDQLTDRDREVIERSL